MLQSLNNLRDFWIHATDGDLGAVRDFYVDEGDWSIPGFVIDTGNWLPGRKVVLPTSAIARDDPENRYLHLARTRDEIRHSPTFVAGMPVGGQIVEALRRVYLPVILPSLEHEFDSPRAPSTPDADPADDLEPRSPSDAGPPRPHPVRDLEKLRVQARDGPVGRVHDLLCDDATWGVRYIVVDEVDVAPGARTLLPLRFVERIDWSAELLHTQLPRDAVCSAPRFDPPITAGFERRLTEYYDQRW